MTIATCVFCGTEQEDYMGTYLIKNDGTIIYYCSSKCRKNHLKLGRDKRKLKWTAAFREKRAKHIAAEAKRQASGEVTSEVKVAKKVSKKK